MKLWKRCRDEHPIPRWQSLDATELSRLAPNLGMLDVRATEAGLRFFVRYSGGAINAANGFDARGKYLDEVIHEHHREQGLAAYHAALDGRQPAYTIQEFLDRNRRTVAFERLVLPFGPDGRVVDRLLTSLEFFCADGAFDTVSLNDSHEPKMILAARIELTAEA